MEKAIVVIVFLSLLFSLTFLNGAAELGVSLQNNRAPEPLEGTTILTTDSYVGKISVYGNRAAWVAYEGDNGTNYNVYGYDGSVISLGTNDYPEDWPSAGSSMVWEAWPDNGSGVIVSNSGEIYSGADGPICPRADGSNVIFKVSDGIKAYYNGGIRKISDYSGYSCPDISGDLAVYGPYIYSFKNGTEWRFSGDDRIESRISGDWIMGVGRNNFGRGVYVEIWNLNWKYDKIIWQMDIGEYYTLDSFNIDGNFVVWSYDGTAYIFNLVTMQLSTHYSPLGSIGEIDVGGGKLLWTVDDDYGKHYIVMGDAPGTPEYVDVVLTSKVSGLHDEFNLLLLVDSSGSRMGYDSSYHHYQEISGGVELSYGDVMRFRVVGNTAGLKYQVIGGSNGKYDLRIERHGATRGSDLIDIVKATDISISKGEIQQYVVDWVKLTQGLKGAVKVSIDKNGDGTFDSSITTSSGNISDETLKAPNSSGESEDTKNLEFGFSMGGTTCFMAIALVLLIVLLLAIRRIRK